jgi:hypothetical protein
VIQRSPVDERTVAAFGGGCIPDLNIPLGLEPVEECADPAVFQTLVVPSGALTVSDLSVGDHNFMCVIHPWMRTSVEVRA